MLRRVFLHQRSLQHAHRPLASKAASKSKAVVRDAADKKDTETADETNVEEKDASPRDFVPLPTQPPVRIPVATLHFAAMPRVNHELRPAVLIPGTHPLRDLMSGEWNFPDYYQHIAPPEAINFGAIPSFTTASRDSTLRHVAATMPNVEFCASSSSTTGVLSQLYYAFSHFRPVDTSQFSLPFQSAPRNYTRAARKPESIYVRRREIGAVDQSQKPSSDEIEDVSVGDDACIAFDHRAPEQHEWDHLKFDESKSKAAANDSRVVWGLDSAKSEGLVKNEILMDLGKSMERMVTLRPEAFSQSLLLNPTKDEPKQGPIEDVSESLLTPQSPESFSFSRVGRILVRSQLDAHDPLLLKRQQDEASPSKSARRTHGKSKKDLLDDIVTEIPPEPYSVLVEQQSAQNEAPSVSSMFTAPVTPSTTSIFDLKTRATNPVRINVGQYFNHLDYRITRMRGLFQSFEREWYDMARSGFMKYAFQLRIGAMAGAFVTYHNTAETFGFEYIPLSKIDTILFGSTAFAELAYHRCCELLQLTLRRILMEQTTKDDAVLKVTASARCNPNEVRFFVERAVSQADLGRRGRFLRIGSAADVAERESFTAQQEKAALLIKRSKQRVVRVGEDDDIGVLHTLAAWPDDLPPLPVHPKQAALDALNADRTHVSSEVVKLLGGEESHILSADSPWRHVPSSAFVIVSRAVVLMKAKPLESGTQSSGTFRAVDANLSYLERELAEVGSPLVDSSDAPVETDVDELISAVKPAVEEEDMAVLNEDDIEEPIEVVADPEVEEAVVEATAAVTPPAPQKDNWDAVYAMLNVGDIGTKEQVAQPETDLSREKKEHGMLIATYRALLPPRPQIFVDFLSTTELRLLCNLAGIDSGDDLAKLASRLEDWILARLPKPNVAVYQQMAHQSRLHSYTMQLSQVLNGKRVRGPFNYEAGDKLESAVRLQLNDNVNTSALAATFADVQAQSNLEKLTPAPDSPYIQQFVESIYAHKHSKAQPESFALYDAERDLFQAVRSPSVKRRKDKDESANKVGSGPLFSERVFAPIKRVGTNSFYSSIRFARLQHYLNSSTLRRVIWKAWSRKFEEKRLAQQQAEKAQKADKTESTTSAQSVADEESKPSNSSAESQGPSVSERLLATVMPTSALRAAYARLAKASKHANPSRYADLVAMKRKGKSDNEANQLSAVMGTADSSQQVAMCVRAMCDQVVNAGQSEAATADQSREEESPRHQLTRHIVAGTLTARSVKTATRWLPIRDLPRVHNVNRMHLRWRAIRPDDKKQPKEADIPL